MPELARKNPFMITVIISKSDSPISRLAYNHLSMKKTTLRYLAILGLLIVCTQYAGAQRLALKTNAIDWLTLTPNLSLEARLNSRLTLDVGLSGNPVKITIANMRFNTFRVQPELRYWFNRPMARHFMGFAMLGGLYDIRFRSHYYKGDAYAAGFTYGYALVLNKHWNMEVTAGIGLARVRAYKWRTGEIKPDDMNFQKWCFIPIRCGLSFAYIFE